MMQRRWLQGDAEEVVAGGCRGGGCRVMQRRWLQSDAEEVVVQILDIDCTASRLVLLPFRGYVHTNTDGRRRTFFRPSVAVVAFIPTRTAPDGRKKKWRVQRNRS